MSDAEIRTDLLKNIFISGGNTLFKNFKLRLKAELEKLLLGVNELVIQDPEERLYSVWCGGSIFSSLSTFDLMSIEKANYDEYGPECVYKMCF